MTLRLASVKGRLVGSDAFRYRVVPWLVQREDRRSRRGALSVAWRPVADARALARERGWPLRECAPAAVQERPPSSTLPEDALRIVRSGRELLRAHPAARGGNLEAAEMYYSHLTSFSRYPVAATFACEVPDALVNGPDGGVATAGFDLLLQSSVVGRLSQPPPLRRLPGAGDRLEGRFVSLLGWDGGINYAHWLLDVMPRLALLPELPDDLRFLVPAVPLPFHHGLLELLGIPAERLVPVESGWVRVERLLLLVAAERSIVPHAVHVRELRRRLVEAVLGASAHTEPRRRLYVSRSSGRRPLGNEAELLPVLETHGFEVVRAEDLTPAEQVRSFAESNVVLGLHGAGIYNELFCSPGATVIELIDPGWWDHGPARVAALLGHRHWFSFAESAGPGHASAYSPTRLEKLLQYALGEGGVVEAAY